MIFSYIVDSYDVWHAKLGHVNSLYVIKYQQLGLINMHDKQNWKCDIDSYHFVVKLKRLHRRFV